MGESVTTLLETEQEFDKDARILIGTTSKCGTGFDHPKLNALLLASDMDEYFIQALGRIFRKIDEETPVVFDLIDKNRVLYKHFESREEVYKEVGAVFETYEI
jgi:superfamily II DNA or RNA helicase